MNICPKCGAYLDAGEKCDCEKEEGEEERSMKKPLTPDKVIAVGFLGFMFTAGSFSYGILFLAICYIGIIWEESEKRNKKRSRHGARP